GQASSGETVDCRGLHILPGVVDSQVHFREPGLEHKEDLETGSRAAALGGVTAVFEMPNTNPLTTSEAALADKVRRATGRMHCDFAFWVGGTRENAKDAGDLERLPGAAGIKVFMGSSTGDLLVEDDEGVASILRNTRRRAAFHSEDEFRLRERLGERIEGDPASHPVWRDEIAALRCTERLVRIARQVRARIHVLHISTAEEIVFLEQHKDVATCEATPHHLTLSADDYAQLGTLIQMNPPVRASRHRDGIWRGIAQGIVDVLGSDHAPHTLAEKAKPYPASPSGMTGVQTLVPIMLDHVNAGRLTLQRFVDLSSHGPQRIFGMARKGRIAAGHDADFTIVDLKRRETITNAQAGSKAGWTPYDGRQVTGWPVGTIVRGRRVMWEGEIVTPGQGSAVEFSEALAV
ncbi:dihydroorotase, partial [Mesorhizobium sp.]|uniref:dihydroorotase n=1 Tax=Mesorhizobium sp. TaxID=1871066 RepID=UPI00257B58BC